jgi:hypothetical protein
MGRISVMSLFERLSASADKRSLARCELLVERSEEVDETVGEMGLRPKVFWCRIYLGICLGIGH